MGKRICEVDDCGTEIPDGRGTQGGLAICDGCRSAQYYWRKKGPKEIAHRKERLHFFELRLDYLSPHIARMVSDAKNRVSEARKRVEKRPAQH